MDVRQLRYFQAVAAQMHFGQAAQRLRISQPALSRQIQTLEQELGTHLFERTNRSVELTASGTLLFERTTEILDLLEKAKSDVVSLTRSRESRLAVSFIHSSTYGLLPAILKRFRSEWPAVELELREMTVAAQIEALATGSVDVALLRPPIEDPAIRFDQILREGFVMALPAAHPRADAGLVDLREFAEERFIMFSQRESPLFFSRIMTLCKQAEFSPQVVQRATQIHTVVGLVAAKLGVAIVPEGARHLQVSGVKFAEIDSEIEPVYVAIACRRDRQNTATQAFMRVARMVAGQWGRPRKFST